ncbi:MAG: mechanosensitive ion channel family protein [Rhodothermales bacterium]
MNDLQTFLARTINEVTLYEWGVSLLTWLGVALALILVRAIVHRYTKRLTDHTENTADDVITDLLAAVRRYVLVLVAFYIAIKTHDLPERINLIADRALLIGVLLQLGHWGGSMIKLSASSYRRRLQDQDNQPNLAAINAIAFLGRVVLWTVALMVILDNFGVDITALVAGLGVGGIAVALAVQNILGDLFAYVSILFDRPFSLGDFLIVGDFMGNVEKIGIKTTRLRSLSGEQLIFSNSDLLGSRIRNYKRMYERRIVFGIGVTYQTEKAQLEAIPGMMRTIIESLDDVRFDRCHFKAFGNFSLDFETVYYVTQPDFALYMDRQQSINLGLFEQFAEAGIEFAYPTQTLFVEHGGREVDTTSAAPTSWPPA